MKSPDFIDLAIKHKLPLRVTNDGDYAMSYRKLIMNKTKLFAIRVTKKGLVLVQNEQEQTYFIRMTNLREHSK